MYYVTCISCMAQHIYIAIRSQRSYDTSKVKNSRTVVGGLQFLYWFVELCNGVSKLVNKVCGIFSSRETGKPLFYAESYNTK